MTVTKEKMFRTAELKLRNLLQTTFMLHPQTTFKEEMKGIPLMHSTGPRSYL